MPIAYYDGTYVEKSAITISPADFGFSRGIAIYEFTRIYGGVPFRLDDHIERLELASKAFGIPCPSRDDIKGVVKKLVAAHNYAHSTIKFYLTAGECGRFPTLGFGGCTDFKPHFMAIEDEVQPQHPEAPKGLELYKQGLKLKTVPFARQMPMVKSINYSLGFVAARDAYAQGFDEILFTHPDGYVTETTMSNFFCVLDGVLVTPKQNMLNGVSRKVMLEIAKTIGIETSERDIYLADLKKATEGFISGSFVEMVPVKKIDDVAYAATTDAPVYRELRKAFSDSIAQFCRR